MYEDYEIIWRKVCRDIIHIVGLTYVKMCVWTVAFENTLKIYTI